MSQFTPSRDCLLRLIEIGWDDLSSSEAAFYRATAEAMRRLIARGTWALTDDLANG
jgi:hypothetical protein